LNRNIAIKHVRADMDRVRLKLGGFAQFAANGIARGGSRSLKNSYFGWHPLRCAWWGPSVD
jgi:hypothetical protein